MIMYKLIFLLTFLILITGCSTLNQEITKQKQTCYCRADKYNCNDFKSRKEAREVYKCCMDKIGRDIHKLDGDRDGLACEW